MRRDAAGADPGLVEVAVQVAAELTVDGRAKLRAAADAAAHQRSLEDVWAGRAPAQEVTRACGLCGHLQSITVPFLRRSCPSCGAIWLPARCSTCATTVIASVREDVGHRSSCACGGVLEGIATIPPMRATRTRAEVAAAVRATRVARRRLRAKAQIAGVLLTLAAAAGTAWLLRAEHATAPHGEPPVVSGPVDTSTPSGQGRAAAQQIVARGGIVSIFACEAAYERASGTNHDATGEPPLAVPTMSADERAYVEGCLGTA